MKECIPVSVGGMTVLLVWVQRSPRQRRDHDTITTPITLVNDDRVSQTASHTLTRGFVSEQVLVATPWTDS